MKKTGRIITMLTALAVILTMTFAAPMTADAASKMTAAAVKGVKASAVSTSSINVSWSKKANAAGYKVYRAASKSGKYKLVKTVKKGSAKSWKNTGLKPGKTYWYKVKAYQKSGKKIRYTKLSAKASAKTKAGMTTAAVKGVKATAVSTSAVKVSWNKKAKATGYKVYRAASKSGKYTLVKTVKKGSTTYWKNTGLKSGKTYWYKVKAYQKSCNKTTYTKLSAKASAKTKASSGSGSKDPGKEDSADKNSNGGEVISSAKILSAKSNGKVIELRWNEKVGEGYGEYEVQKSPAGATYSWKTIAHDAEPYTLKEQPELKNVPEENLVRFSVPDDYVKLFYRDTNVSKGKKYVYRVRSVHGRTKEEWSKVVTVTVPQIDIPNQLCASGDTSGSHKGTHISWGKVSGATSYVLEVKEGTGGTWKKIDTSGAVQDPATKSRLMLDLETVPPAKVCWYRIKACVDGQYSGYSQCVIHGCSVQDGAGGTIDGETVWCVGNPDCIHDMEPDEWFHGADRALMCRTCGYFFINGDEENISTHLDCEGSMSWATTVYRCTKCGWNDWAFN